MNYSDELKSSKKEIKLKLSDKLRLEVRYMKKKKYFLKGSENQENKKSSQAWP